MIRIDFALLDPEPNPNFACDPDSGERKIAKIYKET
jgi:hypothetical protein